SIAEFYLCDDVFISLSLRISVSARQLVEESETHAFLPSFLIRAIPRHPIACQAPRMDRHNPDVPDLSQHRTRSKARSEASRANYTRSRTRRRLSRTLRQLAWSRRYRHSPLIGRSTKALTRSPISSHNLVTWLFECRTGPSPAPSRRRPGSRRCRSKLPGCPDWRLLRDHICFENGRRASQ